MTAIVDVKNWLAQRSDREKLYLFLGGLLIIYACFYYLLQRPLLKERKENKEQINTIKTQQETTKTEITKLYTAMSDPTIVSLVAKRKKLTAHLAEMESKILVSQPTLMSYSELNTFKQRLVDAQKNSGFLIRLQQLPDTEWPPVIEPAANEPKPTDTKVGSKTSGINQLNIQIEFQTDYFQAIAYLQQLERLSSKVYWDKLNYKVIAYPKATVTLNFHLLSMHES